MKLVIDIPESIYDTIQADEMISREQLAVLQMHILNGTLLAEMIEDIKTKIRARVFDIQATSDKYFDGVDDVMDIVDSVIDKHISGGEE